MEKIIKIIAQHFPSVTVVLFRFFFWGGGGGGVVFYEFLFVLTEKTFVNFDLFLM